MAQSIQYAAQLNHVREISLYAAADLGYWTERLREEDLTPIDRDGQAQLMVIAAAGKFMGLSFRELSFSVAAHPVGGNPALPGAYLIRAFNTRRFFAFCERVFFSTPYHYGDVRLAYDSGDAIQLFHEGQPLFSAQLNSKNPAETRAPVQERIAGWQGPIFLPELGKTRRRRPKLFHATIRGHTRIYPFLSEYDLLVIQPPSPSHVLQMLVDSHFMATEWHVRDDAFHAKSKTYPRDVGLAPKAPES